MTDTPPRPSGVARAVTNTRLQTVVGIVLLAIGLGFLCFDLYAHRNSDAPLTFDLHLKITLGIGCVGLLLLPFDFSNAHKAYKTWKNGK